RRAAGRGRRRGRGRILGGGAGGAPLVRATQRSERGVEEARRDADRLGHYAGQELAHSVERLRRRIVDEAEREPIAVEFERQHAVALQEVERQETEGRLTRRLLRLVPRDGHPPRQVLEVSGDPARDRRA